MMMYRKKINNYEVGLVFKDKKLIRVLETGKYWIKTSEIVRVYDKRNSFIQGQDLILLLKEKMLSAMLHIVEVDENELVIVYKNKVYSEVLTNGTFAFWKEPYEYIFDKYNTEELEIPKKAVKTLMKTYGLGKYMVAIEVLSNEKAMLFINDVFEKTLESGTYYLWKNLNKIVAKKVDIRQQILEIAGQEILTSDKANIRINFDVLYQVVDIQKAMVENKDYLRQLYTNMQMQLRAYIGNLSLDELLLTKEEIGKTVVNKSKDFAKNLGVKVVDAGIRDIILPGDIKEIMNQVLVAQKKAQANTISRREETAATRSLLNTAKLMDDNPMLYQLKEMEYVEKIAEKIGEITVSGNGGMVKQLKDIFSVKA